MKKLSLFAALLLCFTAPGAQPKAVLDEHELNLLSLHLGVGHPLSGAILSRPQPCPPATQEVLQ
jgi:hypothetical protein